MTTSCGPIDGVISLTAPRDVGAARAAACRES